MSAKRNQYIDKVCVYCGTNKSASADHVIAREFFQKDQRGYLPKVPSCNQCNNKKSAFESYATTVLPFGSLHDSAKNILNTITPRRLAGNLKLQRELSGGMEDIEKESEIGLTLPLKGKLIIDLYTMIVRGLYWHHWKTIIPKDYVVEIFSLDRNNFTQLYHKLFSSTTNKIISMDIGDGVFRYDYTREDSNPGISAWTLSFYNGIQMVEENPNEKIFFLGVTGPKELIENLSQK